MFVRSKVVKGRTYYQVVESYRSGGKVRHRTLASLGTCPTVEEAYHEALLHFRSGTESRDGKWVIGPWNEASYDRVVQLDRLRERPHGYKTRQEIEADTERRRRAAEGRRAREEELKRLLEAETERRRLEAEDRRAQEERVERQKEQARLLEESLRRLLAEREARSPESAYAVLGLTPPVTAAQVKAAYRSKSLECHPDHGGSAADMARVNDAYERLMRAHGGP
jgi:hypothetical protein